MVSFSEVPIRDYASNARLKDGSPIHLRALRPSDRASIAELFGRLSQESIRYRVFGAKKELTEDELTYLVDIDFVTHVAIVAVLIEDGVPHTVGVGRYYRFPSEGKKNAAELALTVVDAHQGRGIGTLLIESLARIAHADGIEELEAQVMVDNAKMLELLHDSGFVLRKSLHDAIYRVSFPTESTALFLATTGRRAAGSTA